MKHALSYSRARAFDECPLKFQAEYARGKRGASSEAYLIVGSLIHEVCDQYVTHLKDTVQASDFARFEAIFAEVWAGPVREWLPETAREDAWGLALVAREMLVFEDIRKVHGAELKLAVDKDWKPVAYDDPRAFVRGKIDRLDIDTEGNVNVVDYKSGYRIVGISDSIQIKLYARLVVAHFPEVEAVDVELAYFRHRSKRTGRLVMEDMEAARRWIEAIGVDIEKAAKTGEYRARPGVACRGCSAFSTCAARAVSVKPIPPEDETGAVDLVRRLILLERERKEIYESITPWVDQYGSVEVNGMVLGYMKENHLDFEVAKVVPILEKRGLRALRYMKVDTNAIRQLGRMDAKLADELEKSARDGSKTKLKLVIQGEN